MECYAIEILQEIKKFQIDMQSDFFNSQSNFCNRSKILNFSRISETLENFFECKKDFLTSNFKILS